MTTGGHDAGGHGAGELPTACARHADSVAVYQCCECGQLLCHRCVEIGSHLIFCGVCGERAIELDELERHRPALAVPARPDPWQRSAPATSPATDAGVFAVNHVVIPAATIAMVAALLFFLLDVRSVFLSGTEALKWVGFWFVGATVLIARYGRTSANAERQGCYTLALAGATVVAMTVSPWANPAGGFGGSLTNLLIILVVWRFATRLTRRLSFEGLRAKAPEPRLYGIERLSLEQWQKEGGQGNPRGEAPVKDTAAAVTGDDNPVVPVARLAAAGLLAFALGEPFLLSGPASAGERALAAMIVFLLAAAVVLAAGSGLGTLRRVRSLGGQASLGVLPGRIAVAGALMVFLAALALAMPGVEVRGTGARRPAAPETGTLGGDSGEAMEDGSGSEQPAEAKQPRQASGHDRQPAAEKPSEPTTGFSKAASSLVGQFAQLGRWLRFAVIVLAVLLALWGLGWFLGHLGRSRQWLTSNLGRLFRQLQAGIDGLARRLQATLGDLFRRRKKQHPRRRIDPFADWQALQDLGPQEAVVAAYGRLLAVFELLEHPRPERQTPYELLASIPARLKRLTGPTKDLTEIYVKAAYSGAVAGDDDRRRALAALEEVKRLVTDLEAVAGRHRSGAIAAVMIAVLWSGCTAERSENEWVPTHDLIRQLAAAEIASEIGELDFQDPKSKRHLVSGWSWQSRLVWGVGQQSDLDFQVLRLRDLQVSFECRPYAPAGAGTQTLTLEVNGNEIIALPLEKQRTEYRVSLPRESLRLGRNRMRFRYAYSLRPSDFGNQGSKPRAVAWFNLRMEPGTRPAQHRVDAETSRLSLPSGTQIDYYLALEPRSRLIAGDWSFRGPDGGRLEILIEEEGQEEELLATLHKPPPPDGIALSGAEARVARLSLRTVLEGGGEGSQPVVLTRPAVVAPRPDEALGETAEDSTPAADTGPRPNLIIYLVDTLRSDRLGCYGHAGELSPEIDAFAGDSVLFENAFAQSSWTKSSVASILTGLSPLVHGANHRYHVLSSELLTLQEILRSQGYRTAGFVTNVMVSRKFGFDQGFDELTYLGARDGEAVNRAVREWLERQESRSQPFFLYVHTMDPHTPYDPPDDLRQRFAPAVSESTHDELGELERQLRSGEVSRADFEADVLPTLVRLYAAEVASTDRFFGGFRAMLEDFELYDESVVILLSDHGEQFFEHGGLSHGGQLWAELLRVPLILKPAGKNESRRVAAPVQHVDVLPTALDYLGLSAPGGLPGRSLSDLAAEDAPIFSYIQIGKKRTPRISVLEGEWKMIADLDGEQLYNRKLFNVSDDPKEKHNLAASAPVRAGYLSAAIRLHMLAGDPREAEEVTVDEELRRSLQALGYLD